MVPPLDNYRLLPTPKETFELNFSAVNFRIWSFRTPTTIFCTKELYNHGLLPSPRRGRFLQGREGSRSGWRRGVLRQLLRAHQSTRAYFGRRLKATGSSASECERAHNLLNKASRWSKLQKQMTRESVSAQLRLKYHKHIEEILAGTKTHDLEKFFNLVSRRLWDAQDNHRHAEKQTNKLLRVLEPERAQAFVTKGDAPVTMRPGKFHAELEKAGADPDFVRYMISREDLDGEYNDRVFGGEDSDSDMDISDDDM